MLNRLQNRVCLKGHATSFTKLSLHEEHYSACGSKCRMSSVAQMGGFEFIIIIIIILQSAWDFRQ